MADVAWSTIQTGDEVIQVGDSVSAGDVGGEEELEALRASGAVRETDYPDDVAPNESVRERNIRVVAEKMAELEEASFSGPDVDLVPEEHPPAENPAGKEAAEAADAQMGSSGSGSSGAKKSAARSSSSES